MATTYMCDHGFHGTTERRYVDDKGFREMFQGRCAGSVFSAVTGEQSDCECECHTGGWEIQTNENPIRRNNQ